MGICNVSRSVFVSMPKSIVYTLTDLLLTIYSSDERGRGGESEISSFTERSDYIDMWIDLNEL